MFTVGDTSRSSDIATLPGRRPPGFTTNASPDASDGGVWSDALEAEFTELFSWPVLCALNSAMGKALTQTLPDGTPPGAVFVSPVTAIVNSVMGTLVTNTGNQ